MRRILFVCAANSCRSQMAEAWARHLSAGRVEAASAGSRPSGCVDQDAERAMSERGVSLAGQRSKSLEDLPVRLWDAVVSLGCGEAAERVPAVLRYDWRIEDPSGRGLEAFRRVRDELERRVRELVGPDEPGRPGPGAVVSPSKKTFSPEDPRSRPS